MSMKTLRRWLVPVGLAAGLFHAAAGIAPTTAAEGVVKVGLSAPMTGEWAAYGADFKRAVEMALDRVNGAGGLRGKKVALVVADSLGDPKEARLVAERFVADPDIIAQVGDFSSACTMAAAPIFEKAQMVQISPTASHPDWTKKGEFMFRVVATQAAEGAHNARWAVKDLGRKRIATIFIQDDWGVDANRHFTTEARRLGAEVMAEEAFTPGEKDFTAILSKLKKLPLDLVYLSTPYADAAAILNQAKRLHFKSVVMGNSALFSEKTLALAGDALDGVLVPSHFFRRDFRRAARAFTKQYRARYKMEPNQFAALAYDTASLLVAALQKVGTEERAKVREGLLGLKGFEGATGPISYAQGRDPAKELVRLTVKDGKWAIYKP
jgi:branched-chain amino acid transport system substrate-binding protein